MKKLTILISAILFAFTANAQTNFNNNNVTGSNASALGENNTVSGTSSLVSGYNSIVSGNYSTSLGYGNTVNGHGATVIGTLSTTGTTGATAIGNKVDATGSYSFVIGKGQSDYHLLNNISSSLMVGFESNIPTFFVGSSNGHGTFGKVGIGTTTPIATLDVNGDLNFTGTLMQNGQEFSGSLWEEESGNIYYREGNVGIGTDRPEARLDVNGDQKVTGNITVFGNQTISGNVGIGTTTPSSKLSVNGTITATEVIIELNDWKDIVFKEGYSLMSIKETEQFISKNGHLPSIPSEKEMIENGLQTSEMIKLQMQKIEELTLYIIELNKRIETLEKK